MPKRAIIWTAVSSEEQATGDKESLTHQETLGREAAVRHGMTVVEVMRSDDSRSIIRLDVAMRNPRLGYARLVEAIEARAFDVLIYYNTDRLGRNRAIVAAVQEMCAAARIALYDLSNPPQTITPDVGDAQRLVWSLQGATAQSDVEKNRQRFRFGRTARARRGLFLHRIPYGYARAADGGVAADPIAAPVVLRIIDDYLAGHGLPRIAADLNADEVPTAKGRAWQVGTVAMILNNVLRYAGWLEHNRYSRVFRDPYLRVRGQWPPLIDDATAERVQAERVARAANRKLADTSHLLSGVCWCMDCNKPLRISTVQSGRNRLAYLRCRPGAHSFWQARADHVLAYVLHEVTRLTAVDIDALIATLPAPDDPAAAIAVLAADIERLARSLQAADDDYYVAGKLDADRHSRTVNRLQTEIASRRAELGRLHARQQEAAQTGSRRERLADAIAHGPDILRSAETAAANAWLRTHLRVWLKDKEPLLIEWL